MKYSKLVAAIVGLAVLLLHRHAGIDLAGEQAAIVDVILAAVTAWSVYQLPNKEPPT